MMIAIVLLLDLLLIGGIILAARKIIEEIQNVKEKHHKKLWDDEDLIHKNLDFSQKLVFSKDAFEMNTYGVQPYEERELKRMGNAAAINSALNYEIFKPANLCEENDEMYYVDNETGEEYRVQDDSYFFGPAAVGCPIV